MREVLLRLGEDRFVVSEGGITVRGKFARRIEAHKRDRVRSVTLDQPERSGGQEPEDHQLQRDQRAAHGEDGTLRHQAAQGPFLGTIDRHAREIPREKL